MLCLVCEGFVPLGGGDWDHYVVGSGLALMSEMIWMVLPKPISSAMLRGGETALGVPPSSDGVQGTMRFGVGRPPHTRCL